MRNEFLKRNVTEHEGRLFFGHRNMGAQRRHDVDLYAALGQDMVVRIGNKTCIGVEAGKVRRDNENMMQFPALQAF